MPFVKNVDEWLWLCNCGALVSRMLYKCGYCGLPKGRSDAD